MRRVETQTIVEKAINDLKAEGFLVTTKLLIERTGLSRSTFSKDHVLEVLKRNKVCRFKNTKTVNDMDAKNYILRMEKENEKLKHEINKIQSDLDTQIRKNLKLEKIIAEKEDECKTLRGELMALYQRANNRGIDL